MAISSPQLSFLLLLFASAANSATDSYESEDMLQSLRNYGYTLFTNAISTSDLKYQLLPYSSAAAPPTSNFTLFAPRDELLYALDMAADASVYVSTLRYHIIPNHRHTFADLKNLSVPFLDTLLPHYAVLIGKIRDVDVSSDRPSIAVMVDGIRVSFPDLYVGSRIAVHGIDGILLTGLNMSLDLRDDNDYFPPASHASSAIRYDRNNNVSAPAPESSEGYIPPEGTPNPNAPTPSPYLVGEDIPVEATPNNRNEDAATPEVGISTAPISQIDRNDVKAAPVPATPTSHFDSRDNISAAAAPTISQDQTEKLKRLGGKRKHKGKAHRKERRRHRLGKLRTLDL